MRLPALHGDYNVEDKNMSGLKKKPDMPEIRGITGQVCLQWVDFVFIAWYARSFYMNILKNHCANLLNGPAFESDKAD